MVSLSSIWSFVTSFFFFLLNFLRFYLKGLLNQGLLNFKCSFMLQHIHSFLWSNNIPLMVIPPFSYPHLTDGHLGCFYISAIMNNAVPLLYFFSTFDDININFSPELVLSFLFLPHQ